MKRLIPNLNSVQEDIFKKYIQQNNDNPIQTVSTKGTPRRHGLTTFANALAAAESLLGKKVIIITDSEYETKLILKSFVGWPPGLSILDQGNLLITHPQALLAGLTADVIVYETYKTFASLTHIIPLRNTLSTWQLWTRCEKIFVMHG